MGDRCFCLQMSSVLLTAQADSYMLPHNLVIPQHICMFLAMSVSVKECPQGYVCLTFRHCASSIWGQAFHCSPENAFYIFNQQIYFII